MKSYYDAHETAYQQIKSKGFVGWGNAKNLSELGDENTLRFLTQKISQYFPEAKGKKALDVGCGTGTTAFTLAQSGFEVTGIDVSETAIEMGRELAKQQGFEITFFKDDILDLKHNFKKFDLIYDSHFFHCIVFEKDRSLVLKNLKALLANSGILILDTMVMPQEELNPAGEFETLKFDENFILWHKTKPSTDYGVVEVNGQHWCAQRRIYPPEKVLEEVSEAGLTIISEQLDAQPGEPSMLRLVLQA